MPNNAYQRSVRRERELVNKFRAEGYYCCRSAGSKSPWDVWAVHPKTGKVILIQVKTKKGGRGLKIKALNTYLGQIEERWYEYA